MSSNVLLFPGRTFDIVCHQILWSFVFKQGSYTGGRNPPPAVQDFEKPSMFSINLVMQKFYCSKSCLLAFILNKFGETNLI